MIEKRLFRMYVVAFILCAVALINVTISATFIPLAVFNLVVGLWAWRKWWFLRDQEKQAQHLNDLARGIIYRDEISF